jgi:hypothetical protein
VAGNFFAGIFPENFFKKKISGRKNFWKNPEKV